LLFAKDRTGWIEVSKLQDEIFKAFISRLGKAADVSPAMIDGLKKVLRGRWKKKPADLDSNLFTAAR